MRGRDKEILPQVAVADFFKVDIRLGRIIDVEDFPEARKPAYKLCIDFGEPVGTRKSSAQIIKHYKKENLLGRKVWCVVNFPPRQIGPFVSEVLVLGGEDAEGAIVLASIDDGDGFDVPVGASML